MQVQVSAARGQVKSLVCTPHALAAPGPTIRRGSLVKLEEGERGAEIGKKGKSLKEIWRLDAVPVRVPASFNACMFACVQKIYINVFVGQTSHRLNSDVFTLPI